MMKIWGQTSYLDKINDARLFPLRLIGGSMTPITWASYANQPLTSQTKYGQGACSENSNEIFFLHFPSIGTEDN